MIELLNFFKHNISSYSIISLEHRSEKVQNVPKY